MLKRLNIITKEAFRLGLLWLLIASIFYWGCYAAVEAYVLLFNK